MRTAFQNWIDSLTNDSGSGTDGDPLNTGFFETQMGVIDNELTATGGIITENTTYYVSTSGSDTTGDGSVGAPWATITKALETIRNYRIVPGVQVTIEIAAGTYTMSSPLNASPQGVTLMGATVYSRSVNSIQSSSGSAGNYSLVLNLSDVSGIAQNDFALILSPAGGTNPIYLAGGWRVTNVDAANTRITVNSTHYTGVPSGAVTAAVSILTTILYFTGCNGITEPQKASLQNLVIRGDGTNYKGMILYNQDAIYCEKVGICEFGSQGVQLSHSSTLRAFDTAVSSNDSYAIVGNDASCLEMDDTVVAGNGYGVWARGSALIRYDDTDIISGNNNDGLILSQSANITLFSPAALKILGNQGNGMVCRYGARGYTPNIISNNNTGYGFYADGKAYQKITGYTATGNGSGVSSPAIGVVGNSESLIET